MAKRLTRLSQFDLQFIDRFGDVAGVDEVGRGPLAGPVVAAACMIERDVSIRGVNDSKQLSADKRNELYTTLSEHPQVIFAVGFATVEEIDRLNIYHATQLAMRRALGGLPCRPHAILVDGMMLDYQDLHCEKIIGGDAKSQMIAGASICAKVERDAMMCTLAHSYPQWGFEQHKGYATAAHLKALKEHGPSPIHRKNFLSIKELLNSSIDVESTISNETFL